MTQSRIIGTAYKTLTSLKDGLPGPAGVPGRPSYTWIRYADDDQGNGMSNLPIGKEYIGIASNKETAIESDDPSLYSWSLFKGSNGVAGKPGEDGKTYYTWIKYADTPTSGMSDSPEGKDYMGLAHNKETAQESTRYEDYQWSLIRGPQGLQGLQGEDGKDGVPGDPGLNGMTSYFHIKYSALAQPTRPSEISETPNTYIGTYVDYTREDSPNPQDYTWARFQGIQGDRGEDGIPGPNGANGKTSYLHIKYSNVSNPTSPDQINDESGEYIGQYVDFEKKDSTDPRKYNWSKIKGEQGIAGKTKYTWIRYANDEHGNGMSNLPTGKAYIGLAYNKDEPTESNRPGDYKWSKLKGEDGIPGKPGADGKTYYTWVKYSMFSDGRNMDDNPEGKVYIGLAYNKEQQKEGTDPKAYSWTKIKGDQGIKGPAGPDGKTYYTWIKYSKYPDGRDMSDSPDGMKYIGIAYNKTEQTEGKNPRDYTWSLFQGPKGEDGDPENFPDTLPHVPRLKGKVSGISTLYLSWNDGYEDKIYYKYQVYGSRMPNFDIRPENLLYEGNTSSYMFQAAPGETWYFMARVQNSHGRATTPSPKLTLTCPKLDNFDVIANNGAIKDALIENLNANKISAGQISTDILKSNVIEAVNATIGKATIDQAKIGDLSADKITSGFISADRIQAGSITAGKIDADDINAIKVGASEITAGKIKTGEIKVTDANIIDGTISSAKIDKIEISDANIKKGTILDAYIKNLDAGKITSGTLDAGKITVKNLKADSITTGSITVEGNNLIHNSAFKDFSGDLLAKKWRNGGDYKVDTKDKYMNTNSVKISRTGLSSPKWNEFFSEPIPCSQGEHFVLSTQIKTKGFSDPLEDYIQIAIAGLSSETEYEGRQFLVNKQISSNYSSWTKIVISGVVPEGIKSVRFFITSRRNGIANLSQPMLSRGTIASVWKPHNDELISDGAIDNDKLGNNSVSADKLIIDDIFADSAVISKIQTVELNADKITTGTISNERLDLKGFVSFESLDNNLNQIFDTTSGSKKTYINGNAIATGSIHADKLDVNGLTVKNKKQEISFAVSRDGDIQVNGLLQSGNFNNDKKTGYQINTDGKAILNQAEIRGDVKLPNAGITNYGGTIGNPNIAPGTSLGMKPYTANKYFATVMGTTPFSKLGLRNGDTITYRIYLKPTANGNSKARLSYFYGDGKNYKTVYGNVIKKGQEGYSTVSTTLEDIHDKGLYLAIGNDKPDNPEIGTVGEYKEAKFEKGSEATPWCPKEGEVSNPVRFWAGSDYEGRNDAPFRVSQNGDVFANNVDLSGRMFGTIDNGNLRIDSGSLIISNGQKMLGEDGQVYEIQPRAREEYVKLDRNASVFNNNILFGQNVKYLPKDNIFNISKTNFKVESSHGTLFVDTNSDAALRGVNILGPTGGRHVFRGSSSYTGSLVIDAEGDSAPKGDVIFMRKNGQEDCSVRVAGEINIKTKIKSTSNKIEMKAGSDGWGFFAY